MLHWHIFCIDIGIGLDKYVTSTKKVILWKYLHFWKSLIIFEISLILKSPWFWKVLEFKLLHILTFMWFEQFWAFDTFTILWKSELYIVIFVTLTQTIPKLDSLIQLTTYLVVQQNADFDKRRFWQIMF